MYYTVHCTQCTTLYTENYELQWERSSSELKPKLDTLLSIVWYTDTWIWLHNLSLCLTCSQWDTWDLFTEYSDCTAGQYYNQTHFHYSFPNLNCIVQKSKYICQTPFTNISNSYTTIKNVSASKGHCHAENEDEFMIINSF